MNKTILLILAIHLIGGVITHGFAFAYFQRKYPTIAKERYWKNMSYLPIYLLCGFGGLIGHYTGTENHKGFSYGFKLW